MPLDSWVYPAMDRLIALGLHSYRICRYASVDAHGMCAAGQRGCGSHRRRRSANRAKRSGCTRLCRRNLAVKLTLLGGGENAELRLESAYTRGTEIVGKPLTDGDHFGQTIINDYGRPEEQGFNNVSGLSGWATYGPFAVYARGEFQHSPSAPALPLSCARCHIPSRFQPASAASLRPSRYRPTRPPPPSTKADSWIRMWP